MKIGARVFKTGLAVTLSIFLSQLLIPDNSPSLAAIAAITTTMPTVRGSYNMLTRRVLANSIGGIIALIMLYLIGSNPITIGLVTILTITVLNAVNLEDVVSLASITAIIVMLSTSNSIELIALYRVLETIIGVVVSFLVNWLIMPPRHDKPYYNSTTNLTNELHIYIRAILRKNASYELLHQDLKWAESELKKLNVLYELMHNEVIFTKKEQMQQARRLVIYRKMYRTTKATVGLLRTLQKSDDVLHSMPESTRVKLRERIETLMGGHEQILMKFSGRVSADEVRYIHPSKEYRIEFLDEMFQVARQNIEDDSIHVHDSPTVIRIMSAIYEYEQALSQLNNIIRIYKMRYKDNIEQDEKVSIEH